MPFNESITQFTTETSNHADNFNEVHNKLLENDKFLKTDLSNQISILSNDRGYLTSYNYIDIDVDTIQKNGKFKGNRDCVHIPEAQAWLMDVCVYDKNFIRQEIYMNSTKNTYERYCHNGVWGDWKQIATTDKIDALSEVRSLEEVGLSDKDMSPTDFSSNVVKILDAMPKYKVLRFLAMATTTPNLNASISEEAVSKSNHYILTVEKTTSNSAPNKITIQPNTINGKVVEQWGYYDDVWGGFKTVATTDKIDDEIKEVSKVLYGSRSYVGETDTRYAFSSVVDLDRLYYLSCTTSPRTGKIFFNVGGADYLLMRCTGNVYEKLTPCDGKSFFAGMILPVKFTVISGFNVALIANSNYATTDKIYYDIPYNDAYVSRDYYDAQLVKNSLGQVTFNTTFQRKDGASLVAGEQVIAVLPLGWRPKNHTSVPLRITPETPKQSSVFINRATGEVLVNLGVASNIASFAVTYYV